MGTTGPGKDTVWTMTYVCRLFSVPTPPMPPATPGWHVNSLRTGNFVSLVNGYILNTENRVQHVVSAQSILVRRMHECVCVCVYLSCNCVTLDLVISMSSSDFGEMAWDKP